jgi:hypothetical protein
VVERTAGASGAFIRELLRKAAVFAAESSNGDELLIRERGVDEALAELLLAGGAPTHSLLGASVKGKNGKPTAVPQAGCSSNNAIFTTFIVSADCHHLGGRFCHRNPAGTPYRDSEDKWPLGDR